MEGYETEKWGLALSGGGARGIIHVGVLQAFEDVGFRPVCVAGTSIGAIVGVLYANGMRPEEMMKLILAKSFLRMFGIKPSLSGFLEMKYLKAILQKYVPETFEELQMPFMALATNLSKRENVVFDQGALHQAVIASATIPVLFEPVEIDGDKYVDGGVIDNLPSSACKSKCDKVLGIEVNHGKFSPDLRNMKNVAMEIFQMIIDQNSQKGMNACDELIMPELDETFQLLDFSKSKTLFDIGLKEGQDWLKKHGH